MFESSLQQRHRHLAHFVPRCVIKVADQNGTPFVRNGTGPEPRQAEEPQQALLGYVFLADVGKHAQPQCESPLQLRIDRADTQPAKRSLA